MAAAVVNLVRLARAGLVLAQHGVRFVPKGMPVPWPLRLAWIALIVAGAMAALVVPWHFARRAAERRARMR